MGGALAGVRIIEIAGIGPGPFAAMMLADHGAEVIRIERRGVATNVHDPLLRSRKSVELDLKSESDKAALRALVRTADGLIEGFRPGVMERLELGPDALLSENPKLVYGRITGWGQTGPLADIAGHDIGFISIAGVLGSCGYADSRPTIPINLVADMGGGGMLLAFGMVTALLAARGGAPGQVIDCAMTDGAALLMAMMWGYRSQGRWSDAHGTNALDGGVPYYNVYATSDGGHVAIGPVEPQFYAALLKGLGLHDDPLFAEQRNRKAWPEQTRRLAEIFASDTRAAWTERLQHLDACFTPVLTMGESATHPHNVARGTYITVGDVLQPAPAPRFSATPAPQPMPTPAVGADQHLVQ